jgi:hypothetical protein
MVKWQYDELQLPVVMEECWQELERGAEPLSSLIPRANKPTRQYG